MSDKQLEKETYSPKEIEPKWQAKWLKERTYQPDMDNAKKPYYNLMMFPYPSAEGMHVGNMYAQTGADIHARFQRMQGNDVFEPFGLDGFGIHAENYALKIGAHPMDHAEITEANFYRQARETGSSIDWSRTVETYKPEYYQWTQWIFTKLFQAGLAYKAKAPVNFCPSCKTVLADEQVIDGKCERCSSVVERRELEQWFFEITKYADRLLAGLDQIDWTEKVKIAQRNWIGRKEGTEFIWQVTDDAGKTKELQIVTFTTRRDTLPGVTFMVLALESPYVSHVTTDEQKGKVDKYISEQTAKSTEEKAKEKTGVFTGSYAKNPFNGQIVPIYVADYVLSGYGTGAVMGMPGHDERDLEFAKVFDLPVEFTTEVPEGFEGVYTGKGKQINSGDGYDGLTNKEAGEKIFAELAEKGFANVSVQYHLRDWLISRQRYWGPPIPMIFCEACAKAGKSEIEAKSWSSAGWYAVPEKDLPVTLPHIDDFKPLGTGKAPLANHPEFYNTKCPGCGGEAKRETDVSDTFLDSAWYFLRYIDTENQKEAWSEKRAKKWMPVNIYIGGAEHSVLHLLYARFIPMAFHDMGLLTFDEPFPRFYAHGLIVKDGAKMSKSKGNVVVPDEYIGKFGSDTLRTYLMFIGPFNEGGDFRDTGIEGMNRFIKRVWTLLTSHSISDTPDSQSARSALHKTIKANTEDMKALRFNTSIAKLMELYNILSKETSISKETAENFLKLLAPFAPHMTEELWHRLGNTDSIHLSSWPVFDPKAIEETDVTIAIQVNGKLRDTLTLAKEKAGKETIEKMARESENVKRHLEGKTIKTVIYVPSRLINFVVS